MTEHNSYLGWLIRNVALAAVALSFTFATQAQERWYSVEVIIFERTSSAGLASELWPEQVEEPSLGLMLSASGDNSVGLLDSAGRQGELIEPMGDESLSLKDVARKLARSGRYTPLTHQGWRQPTMDKTQALPVTIDTGPVRGTIRLYVARYLHAEAHLVFENPSAAAEAQFELKESRRMRSGELHYFDHPVFGMLLRATPYEAPGGEYLPAPTQQQPATDPNTESTNQPAKPAQS